MALKLPLFLLRNPGAVPALRGRAPDYLSVEPAERLAREPVRFDLELQLAGRDHL